LIDLIFTQLKKQDGETITTAYQKQRLICHYSARRAAKDKSDRAKPRFKMFLDNHGVACPLVLKKLEDKSYISTILELEKTYGSFIKRAGEIYGCEKISAYKINPAMEEIECLN